MGSGNEGTKEDYRDLAIAYVENGENMAQALRDCGRDPSNGSRTKKLPAFQEALEEVRAELCEETGCTRDQVVEMIMKIYKEIDGRNMSACATDAARLAEVKLKCIDKLTKIMGYEAPTKHLRVEGSLGNAELASMINNTQINKITAMKEIAVKQE